MDAAAGITPTYECSFDISRGEALLVGPGSAGRRVVAAVGGGTVTGERISGTIVGPGADWVLMGRDGWGRVDVRLQIATGDGACIYVEYCGLMEMNAATAAALADGATETTFDDQYFVITPRMECGDERYGWVNHTMFVARGRLTRGGVCYEVYRI